jgi:hypothetical protein
MPRVFGLGCGALWPRLPYLRGLDSSCSIRLGTLDSHSLHSFPSNATVMAQQNGNIQVADDLRSRPSSRVMVRPALLQRMKKQSVPFFSQ